MKLNSPNPAEGTAFDGERLLAVSSLLRNSSKEFEFLLQGTSMGRVLPDGSRIRVRFAEKGSFKPGQVLTYVAEARLLAHRLVRFVKSKNNTYLITRGDATVCCDLPVLESSVLGVVEAFSIAGEWQPVGPPTENWPGFRWLALVISSLVGSLLRVNPACAVWAAKRIIGIHGLFERVTGFLRRNAAFGFGAGSAF